MKIAILPALILFNTCFAQNVGIGTTNPTRGRLEVVGAAGNTSAMFGGDGAGIALWRNGPAIGFNLYSNGTATSMAKGISFLQWLNMANGSFVLDQGGNVSGSNFPVPLSRRLTIQQNGNVSVNAGEANASLFVGASEIGIPTAAFRGSQYSSVFYHNRIPGPNYRDTYINAGKNRGVVYLNDKPGGNLMIGLDTCKVGINTDPRDLFEVKQISGRGLALINSNFNYWEMFGEKNRDSDSSDMYLYYNGGNLGNFFSRDGKYYSYSDRRVKTNIQPLGSTLAGVLGLKPYLYHMKYAGEGKLKNMGFLAQDVRSVFPEVTEHVISDELGYPGMTDLYSINYDGLGPIALKAIQEQQMTIADLKKKVEGMKKRLEIVKHAMRSETNQ